MSQIQDRPAVDAHVRPASFATLLVHVEPGDRSTRRVEAAAELARSLGARLIGLGAETLDPYPVADPFSGAFSAEWVAAAQEQVAGNLQAAEAGFRKDAAGAEIEWRSVQDFPHRALARVARAADLIVVGPKSATAPAHSPDPAEVVMQSGRPVLIVPDAGHPRLRLGAVVVAWKDTREARRAVADAMPFLVCAQDVIVQAVCEDDAIEDVRFQAEDVAAALRRHGVKARANIVAAKPENVTIELMRTVDVAQAGLLVAGAYGHSRFSEWVFGGVTDDLLHRPGCFVLLSH